MTLSPQRGRGTSCRCSAREDHLRRPPDDCAGQSSLAAVARHQRSARGLCRAGRRACRATDRLRAALAARRRRSWCIAMPASAARRRRPSWRSVRSIRSATNMRSRIALRRASPTATPNPLIVALADAMLGRCGRMIAADGSHGSGLARAEGVPFRLELCGPIPGINGKSSLTSQSFMACRQVAAMLPILSRNVRQSGMRSS